MTLDEFIIIYNEHGDLYARLVIEQITDCDLLSFIRVCPELSKYFPCDGYAWNILLQKSINTLYSIHCPWYKLTGTDWCILLIYQPTFHIYCDWIKFDKVNWDVLLGHRPEFTQFRT